MTDLADVPLEDFSYVHEMSVRYRDLDDLGHVNNVVHATYFEEGRIHYLNHVLDRGVPNLDTVIVHLEVDFVRPVEYDDDLRVGVRVPELGRSSLPFEYRVEADGELASTGGTVQVMRGEDGTSTPIRDEVRAAIEAFEGR